MSNLQLVKHAFAEGYEKQQKRHKLTEREERELFDTSTSSALGESLSPNAYNHRRGRAMAQLEAAGVRESDIPDALRSPGAHNFVSTLGGAGLGQVSAGTLAALIAGKNHIPGAVGLGAIGGAIGGSLYSQRQGNNAIEEARQRVHGKELDPGRIRDQDALLDYLGNPGHVQGQADLKAILQGDTSRSPSALGHMGRDLLGVGLIPHVGRTWMNRDELQDR